MPNPIADPLVENVLSADLEGLVSLTSELEGTVTVQLARPGNPLDSEVAEALKQAFETLHGADHIRAVFLRGTGGEFFGGPVDEWMRTAASDWSEGDLKNEAMASADMLAALTHIPALTVALPQGVVTGLGAGLVAACDMAVAAADATFALPEVKDGSLAAMAAPYVVNAVGPRQAKALFMTGRTFDAAYALQIGLVQQVVAAGQLGEAALAVAHEVMQNAPGAMHAAKALVWDVWGKPLERGLREHTAKAFARLRHGDEGREGLDAVLEKRPPAWARP